MVGVFVFGMKFLSLLVLAFGLCSCGDGRVGALQSRVEELERRLVAAEERVGKHQAALVVQGEINDRDAREVDALGELAFVQCCEQLEGMAKSAVGTPSEPLMRKMALDVADRCVRMGRVEKKNVAAFVDSFFSRALQVKR